MGSKSKLANRIVSLFPRADHFFDLFCGGSAVSHCTLLRGSYPHIHINDINPMMPEAFVKALQGGFDDEDRWISREDFFRLKDSDPYVAICFSFGNNLKTYCYGPDVEPIKKALHYAVFFDSYELSDKLIGIDLRPIQKRAKRQEKYLLAKRLIKAAYAESTLPNIYCSKTGQDSGVCRLQSYERQVCIEDIAQKKKLNTTRPSELGRAQEMLNIMLQSWQNMRRLQTITPPLTTGGIGTSGWHAQAHRSIKRQQGVHP